MIHEEPEQFAGPPKKPRERPFSPVTRGFPREQGNPRGGYTESGVGEPLQDVDRARSRRRCPAYRARFRSRLAALHRSLDTAHDERKGSIFIRFGTETPDLHASLADDLMAWLQRRRGKTSALDGDDPRFTHAYAGVRFETSGIVHVFYWSPGQLDFFHADNWGADGCRAPGCPWPWDPRKAGFGPSSRPEPFP